LHVLSQIVTERETWILGNKDSGVDDVVQNAKTIDPGYDMMTPMQQANLRQEVELVLSSIYKTHGKGQYKKKLLVNDTIADITLQQVLTRASDFDVIATMNLNGDYLR
jgi:isocitrate dehydrogenase